MLRAAGWTVAPPAALDKIAGGPAIRAEAVARVPADERLALGERRQVLGGDEAAHGDRAQIRDDEVVARLERFSAGGIEPDGKSRRAVDEPEKDGLRRAPERARLGRREQRIIDLGGLL